MRSGPLTINRRSPLARGLAALMIPRNRLFTDLVTGLSWSTAGNPGLFVSQKGVIGSFVSASSNRLESAFSISAIPLTIAARLKSSSTAGVQTVGSVGLSDAASDFARLILYQSKVQAQLGANAAGSDLVASTVNYSTTEFFSAAATFKNAGTVKAYMNGTNVGSTSTTKTPAAFARAAVGKNFNSGSFEYPDASIEYVGFWRRDLTAMEIMMLHFYPEQLVRPTVRLVRTKVKAVAASTTRPVKMVGEWGGFAGESGGFVG